VKIVYAVLGWLSLVLGVLGIFLPLLPTTPFLLLSAALFAKSSDKLYNWLMNHEVFGKIIRTYQEGDPIPLKVKIGAVSLFWCTILISVFTIANSKWWLQLILISFALGATVYVFSHRPSKK
jgi:uncharacterized membrane protein YbaN (DUF454 family)